MQWHQVARQQAECVERKIDGAALGLPILIDRLDTGIGSQQIRCLRQRRRQLLQMAGKEPVVIVQEEQVGAVCRVERHVGGATAMPWTVA